MPGTVIRKYRELRNYSQDYVARKMGISQNAYSKIENNITQLTVNHVKQISTILEVSIMDLLRDDFEIHGAPKNHMDSVSKEELVLMAERIKHRLVERSPLKHDFYPVIMSMLQTIDSTVSNVH
jgi:transcriptional regulator with XRE-family HTH domain